MAIVNKRARHDYSIEERYECGIVLRGWEVKSVRAGRAQIGQAHIYIRDGELFLCNAHMNPADQVCTHETLETNRTRKLLMHRKEIMKLIGRVERQGYALIPLDLHFTRGRVKCEMALARGKREYEKRADESKKEWKREQERIMKKDAKGRHILCRPAGLNTPSRRPSAGAASFRLPPPFRARLSMTDTPPASLLDERTRTRRCTAAMAALLIFTLVFAAVAIGLGRYSLSLADVRSVFMPDLFD